VKAYSVYGSDFDKISSLVFKNRTCFNVKNRFYTHVKKKKLYNELLDEANKIYDIEPPRQRGQDPIIISKSEIGSQNLNPGMLSEL